MRNQDDLPVRVGHRSDSQFQMELTRSASCEISEPRDVSSEANRNRLKKEEESEKGRAGARGKGVSGEGKGASRSHPH